MGGITTTLLPETIRNIEKEVGLTLEQMNSMDLCEIENYIKGRKGYQTMPAPEIYRKARDVRIAMGKILTADQYKKDMQRLIKKYAN